MRECDVGESIGDIRFGDDPRLHPLENLWLLLLALISREGEADLSREEVKEFFLPCCAADPGEWSLFCAFLFSAALLKLLSLLLLLLLLLLFVFNCGSVNMMASATQDCIIFTPSYIVLQFSHVLKHSIVSFCVEGSSAATISFFLTAPNDDDDVVDDVLENTSAFEEELLFMWVADSTSSFIFLCKLVMRVKHSNNVNSARLFFRFSSFRNSVAKSVLFSKILMACAAKTDHLGMAWFGNWRKCSPMECTTSRKED